MYMNNQSAGNLNTEVFRGYAARWPSYIALGMISVYRIALSPVLFSLWGPGCRFEPTCSAYAFEAISRYGIIYGGLLALKRLISCRPLGRWGLDPVPSMHYIIESISERGT